LQLIAIISASITTATKQPEPTNARTAKAPITWACAASCWASSELNDYGPGSQSNLGMGRGVTERRANRQCNSVMTLQLCWIPSGRYAVVASNLTRKRA
jgi:hypothetical protein